MNLATRHLRRGQPRQATELHRAHASSPPGPSVRTTGRPPYRAHVAALLSLRQVIPFDAVGRTT
jgi:hypothetical protein